MNDDQNLQSDDFKQSDLSLEEKYQHLADLLNENPPITGSLSVMITWFLGSFRALFGWFFFFFLAVPEFFYLMGHFFGFCSTGNAITYAIASFIGAVIGIILLYPHYKTFFLLRKGYFSVGHLTSDGIIYKDRRGNQQCLGEAGWGTFLFDFTAGFTGRFRSCCCHEDGTYLIVSGNNPRNIMILDASNFFRYHSQDERVTFSVFMGTYEIYPLYDLKNRKFIINPPKILQYMILTGTVLWMLLCFWEAFLQGK
ncbi:MAG: hypothetical protein IJF84_10585 [Thermoguttaceae bacterium]|nr:hypothetical protein [Thermoguttaceae bacterium]